MTSTGALADAASHLWAEYTVLAAAGNPYARAANAYNHLVTSFKPDKIDQGDGPKCKPIRFEDFAADPVALVVQAGAFRCWADPPPPGRGTPPYLSYLRHVEPLAPCLTTATGDLAVDYLFRSKPEYLVGDLLDAAAREPRLGLDAEGLSAWGRRWRAEHPEGGAAGSAAERFRECGDVNACARAIGDFYREDLELLGYGAAVQDGGTES